MSAYRIQDGDTDLPYGICHVASATMGWCEMCACWRQSPNWTEVRVRSRPYHVCAKHLPLEYEAWTQEQESSHD